ncbi:unnamed protein product [Meloidogyne enterolobii]|uniref:Uncharacterized protein n=1 Tax=Meloidogyne enterolobii TaxID=390850 RepID=A0ACB0YS76_MELEN
MDRTKNEQKIFTLRTVLNLLNEWKNFIFQNEKHPFSSHKNWSVSQEGLIEFIWPYTQNFSPNNILTTPTTLITPSSSTQQQSFLLNSQQQYLHSFQFPSPPFFIQNNLTPNFSTFFSSPPSSSNTNPFLTAFFTSLFQKQFILNQLQKQQITSIFQQNTPPSFNSTPGTSNSEDSWRTNNSSNNLTSFKYPNNIYPTTTKISKIVEKVTNEKKLLNKSSCKRKNENKELKETPKRRKINNILINNNDNNNIQKVQCNVCGKSFGRPCLLNGHKRIHGLAIL